MAKMMQCSSERLFRRGHLVCRVVCVAGKDPSKQGNVVIPGASMEYKNPSSLDTQQKSEKTCKSPDLGLGPENLLNTDKIGAAKKVFLVNCPLSPAKHRGFDEKSDND